MERQGDIAMDILYLLIPLSVALVFAAAGVFWWALSSGQFEDLEGPAHRILTDDDPLDVDQSTGRRAD
jgi:cbb3-type cytochrome oxidase maturation protein